MMKLDAAAFVRSHSGTHSLLAGLLFAGLATLLITGSAQALDGIMLSGSDAPEAEAGAEASGCPALIQIKYPFLSCANGQIGQSDSNETWDDSRRIQIMSDWTEGDGYWGPDLNVD
jgi:hypothetical protein